MQRKMIKVITAMMMSVAIPLVADATAMHYTEYYGKVTANGKGVKDVPVTDGTQVVVTDAKGNYKMTSADDAQFVYITLPSGYEVTYGDSTTPTLYKAVSGNNAKKERIDFTLTPRSVDDSNHVLIVIADPQVYFDDEIPELKQGSADVRNLLASPRYKDKSAIGICVGDVIGNISRKPLLFGDVTDAINEIRIPFFFVVGNHDMAYSGKYDDDTKSTFKSIYGPDYYSFNFGGVHYVVLDNVFSIGSRYVGYLSEKQLKWLEQDLALVPHGSEVVVASHIPLYSPAGRAKNWGKEDSKKIVNNRSTLISMLKPYKAQVLSGHEHYNENYILSDSLYEHVHAPISNLFWMAPWSWDGSPSGYGVYEITNSKVTNWYYKSVGYAPSYQMEVYPVGRSREHPEAVVVNVFNRDTSWKVVWYENGELRGEMTPYYGYDPNIWDYVVEHEKGFKHKYIGADRTEHMYYAVPQIKGSTVRVEATDYNGNTFIQEISNSN